MGGPILLVEDSALVVEALTILLESAGHEVRAARSVADAVASCRAQRPAVMLLDLTLPDGHGLSVLDELRGTDAQPAVTAALTGHEEPAIVARCHAAGCRAVLLKPVSTRELVKLVAEWAGESEG